ncbi:hypothetical protein BDFB_001482 [Asbolus verrucosus]|uniref:Uncharacterized protein n=1 Tax=Asbolus verrucosus TaxID=1661398 RepID=A0A482WDD1_ASBVE|nr:hypothetical protein BDFB_001482 [Asbolus verrucosus]
MPCSTVHDGFATIRRPRVGPPRAPPRPPSLASVPEDPRIGCLTSPLGKPAIPWWELATRRSRYRSCPTLELHVSIQLVCNYVCVYTGSIQFMLMVIEVSLKLVHKS